jgi:hypothetical protein
VPDAVRELSDLSLDLQELDMGLNWANKKNRKYNNSLETILKNAPKSA